MIDKDKRTHQKTSEAAIAVFVATFVKVDGDVEDHTKNGHNYSCYHLRLVFVNPLSD